MAAAQLLLSLVDLRSSQAAKASERAREAFGLYTQLEDDRSRARCVLVLAASAAERGDGELAARLSGAAEALRGDEPPDEFEAPLLEQYLAGLAVSLGAQSLAALTAEGRSLETFALEPVVVSAEVEA